MATCSHAEPEATGRCIVCIAPLDPMNYYRRTAGPMGPTRESHLEINGFVLPAETTDAAAKAMVQALASHNRVWWISRTGIRVHPSAL